MNLHKRISVAYKYLPKDGVNEWIPGRKKLTDRRVAEIEKKWDDLQLTPLERKKNKMMDKTDKAVNRLYDNPDLTDEEINERIGELYDKEEKKIKEIEGKYEK